MDIRISPSVLSADFSDLGSAVEKLGRCGADMIHIDVMDGHFVPNITIGAPVVKAIRRCTDLDFDVHLMISDPLFYAEDFAKAGADIITFHPESPAPVKETIDRIRSLGCRVGLSIKPKSSTDILLPYLDMIDLVLVMTVEPGFGGQKFMADMLPKIRELRKLKPDMDISVDGGIDADTAPLAVEAGANILVSGSYLFRQEDMSGAIMRLKGKDI